MLLINLMKEFDIHNSKLKAIDGTSLSLESNTIATRTASTKLSLVQVNKKLIHLHKLVPSLQEILQHHFGVDHLSNQTAYLTADDIKLPSLITPPMGTNTFERLKWKEPKSRREEKVKGTKKPLANSLARDHWRKSEASLERGL